MDSKAGGLMDGSASDMRDARLCVCRTQTVLKKASRNVRRQNEIRIARRKPCFARTNHRV